MKVSNSDHSRNILLRGRLLPFIVATLLLFQILDPYRGWKILLVGLGGVLLLALIWTRSLALGLKLERDMQHGWAKVGDRLMERIRVINHSRWPAPWVEIVDHSSLPYSRSGRVIDVSGADEKVWTRIHICERRGLYEIGPTRIRAGDPFGLFTVEIENPQVRTLLVTPPIVSLPAVHVAQGGRLGEGRASRKSLIRRVSSAGLREYVPGDSLRHVHWPSTARHGSLVVRMQEGIATQDWWIVLDLNAAMQVGVGPDSTEELAIIVAASLADRGLRRGRKVGLVGFGPDLIWLPSRADPSQRERILRSLALARSGGQDLSEVLELTRRTTRGSSSLIIITADTRTDWLAALNPLLRRGAAATVLLIDPSSFGSQRDGAAVKAALASNQVPHYEVGIELLERPEINRIEEVRWEWLHGMTVGEF